MAQANLPSSLDARKSSADAKLSIVLVVNDPATMGRASGRVEIEPHRLQDRDHGLRQMGGSEYIAAEVEQQILWFGRCRGPIQVWFLPPHELKLGEHVDFAKYFANENVSIIDRRRNGFSRRVSVAPIR